MHDIVRAQWPVRLPVVRADGVADGRGRAAVARMRRAVQGINFDRGELTIRDGKDGKDRVTMLRSAIAQSAFLRPALNLPNARTVGVLAPWNAHEPADSLHRRGCPRVVGWGEQRCPAKGGPHSPDEARLRWRCLRSKSERSAGAAESRCSRTTSSKKSRLCLAPIDLKICRGSRDVIDCRHESEVAGIRAGALDVCGVTKIDRLQKPISSRRQYSMPDSMPKHRPSDTSLSSAPRRGTQSASSSQWMEPEPMWFTVSQLSQRWQLDRKTIYKFIDCKILPVWRVGTHLYRVAVADILRFEARNRLHHK